nr:MAG TPA: hypothetical protein [Caudoviricetes sp.]
MAIHGESLIQLYDSAGAVVEERHDTNMVTHAIRDILTMNPWGFKDYTSLKAGNYWRGLYPIAKNLLGGIVLFPSTLTEDADAYYAPAKNIPTGYASIDAYTGADPKRGQYNASESGPLPNGYRFVYDYATDRANGTIAAVALTHADAGKRWQGSDYDALKGYDAAWWNELVAYDSDIAFDTADAITFGGWMNDVLYGASIPTSGSGTTPVTWKSIPYARGTVGVNTIAKPVSATASTITLSADYRKTSSRSSLLCWDHDICHVLATPGNATGNASIQHATITAGAMHEETLTVPAQIAVDEHALLGVSDNILYAIDTGRAGIWRIDLASGAAALLPLPSGMPKLSVFNLYQGYNSYQGYNPWSDRHLAVQVYGDDSRYYGILICDDTIISIGAQDAQYYGNIGSSSGYSFSSSGSGNASNSNSCGSSGPYMLNDYMYSASVHYLRLLMRTTYLATIDNLQTPVVKDATRTMKITYTITES